VPDKQRLKIAQSHLNGIYALHESASSPEPHGRDNIMLLRNEIGRILG